jgi:hypothetical protein
MLLGRRQATLRDSVPRRSTAPTISWLWRQGYARISGFYSSKTAFSNGKTVREWLAGQSFEAQKEFGLKAERLRGAQLTEADLLIATVSDLCALFRDRACSHGAAISRGSHRAANRAHDDLHQIALELRRRGETESLASLLSDTEVATRLWAAKYSLDLLPSHAEATLEALAAGEPGPIRLTAEVTLEAWRRGDLDVTA